jgi:hypothetical protein
MKYPLYDELKKKLEKNKGPPIDQAQYLNLVRRCKKDEMENLTRIIFYHYRLQYPNSPRGIPYSGQVVYGGKGIVINLDHLPPELCDLLYTYVAHVRLGSN